MLFVKRVLEWFLLMMVGILVRVLFFLIIGILLLLVVMIKVLFLIKVLMLFNFMICFGSGDGII